MAHLWQRQSTDHDGLFTQALDSGVRFGIMGKFVVHLFLNSGAGIGAVDSAWTIRAGVGLKTLPVLADTAYNIGRFSFLFGMSL